MTKSTVPRPITPCVGICSTGIGDAVCRGCKRFTEEVIQWNAYSDDERRAVLRRLDTLLVQTMRAKFYIFDEGRLEQQLRYQQIRFQADKDPYTWLYELLRSGAKQIKKLEDYGVRFHAEFAPVDLSELRLQVDAEHYELSCVYFERHVSPMQVV